MDSVMRVGVGRYVIHIPGARTLKDRRHVVKSFKDRVRARQPVSIAEIGDANRLQVATFGVAVVSGSADICHDVLNAVTSMASELPEALLSEVNTEIIPLGDDGEGIAQGRPDFASAPRRDPLHIEPVRRKKGTSA
jgi:uncharacterized protein YlxP (DUF503 family)